MFSCTYLEEEEKYIPKQKGQGCTRLGRSND